MSAELDLDAMFARGGSRPNWCPGAFITHNTAGEILPKPFRVPCEMETMPDKGLCSLCAARELSVRDAIAAKAARGQELEERARKAPRRTGG